MDDGRIGTEDKTSDQTVIPLFSLLMLFAVLFTSVY